jgi:hypothetical protein
MLEVNLVKNNPGRRIYFFNPLPVPPPYKQHWERKIEEEDLATKEFAISTAAKETSIEFSKCSHSESMFDEGSGVCMSCGAFMGLCFAPLSANTSGIPGAHHHAFSSAATSSASRKKKIVAAAALAAAGMITFDSSSADAVIVATPELVEKSANRSPKEKINSVSSGSSSSFINASVSSAMFPLFYEGQKIVMFDGKIPVYEPSIFSFCKNKQSLASSGLPLCEHKKRAFISYMHQISEEAFGKMFPSTYHPLDNIIATGIYSFTGYGFCRHSLSSSSSTGSEKIKTSELNKQIVDAIPNIVEDDFEFYSSKRRRTQISLFVAIVTAHILVVHKQDLKSIQECLDIQRLRAKVKASLISKDTQSSFYHAIGSRLGIDSKCSGRLVQDAYEMYISKYLTSKNSSESPSHV